LQSAENCYSVQFINDTPQVSLETATEHVRGVLASYNELQSAAASAVKAFVLYRKTRPGPSLESIKRSRGLEPEGLHPILAQALPASDLGALPSCNRVEPYSKPSTYI